MDSRELTSRVQEVILRAGPDASVNDLCRMCLDKGLHVTKPLVTAVRRQLITTLHRTRYLPDEQVVEIIVENEPSAAAQRAELLHADPAALAKAAEEKRIKQEEREKQWAARAAEKEAAWQAEREAEEKRLMEELEREVEQEAQAVINHPEGTVAPAAETSTVANINVTAPPPEARRRTTAGRMLRRQFLNELLDEDPGMDPQVIMGKMKERFGIALDWRYIYDTCRVAREVHKLPQIPEYPAHDTRASGSRIPLPVFDPTDDEMEFAETPEEEFKWLARQANDIMRAHGLTELSLVVENGKAKWKFQIVKREEGEITL